MSEEIEIVYPSLFDFCFNHPLYEKIDFNTEGGKGALYDWYVFSGNSDGYCVNCQNSTVFSTIKSLLGRLAIAAGEFDNDRLFSMIFRCARDPSHNPIFYLRQIDSVVEKIGHYPSLADTAIGELNEYRKLLSIENSSEFYKALGLAAHGVGIGSFVYLRRVLERLVKNRESLAIESGDKQEAEFEGKRVAERIKLLSGYLPALLVENTAIYTVLSKGVHELSEQECLKFFPIIRDLMLLILEEDLENKRKEELQKAAESELKKIIGS